jgi:hypothetical protein
MSSAVLYLAIVAVWGIVLVPMWLRRDGEGITRLLRRGEFPDAVITSEVEPASEVSSEAEAFEEAPRVRRTGGAGRAAVIARRRRRTLGLTLLVIAATVVVVLGLTPWWFVAPPAGLLIGHLSLLRVAVKMDSVRQAEARAAAAARAVEARRRREAIEAREAREAEEASRTAEVIELPGLQREEVYDQYTDRRAVGD